MKINPLHSCLRDLSQIFILLLKVIGGRFYAQNNGKTPGTKSKPNGHQ